MNEEKKKLKKKIKKILRKEHLSRFTKANVFYFNSKVKLFYQTKKEKKKKRKIRIMHLLKCHKIMNL